MIRFAFLGLLIGLVSVFTMKAANAHSPSQSLAPPLLKDMDFPIIFGGPFSLIDHRGRKRTDKDFQGRFVLITFGYTYCPDICPTGLQTMGQALDLVGAKAAEIQPVFVSIDPERDHPEVLKGYVANFHPRLIGLTGTEKQVRAVARRYRLHRGKVFLPDAPKDEYLVSHTPTTFLMGPDGKFVTLFPYGTEPGVMAKALVRYISANRS